MAKTKIICTIGPASNRETVLRKMIMAGMDVARFNFSHGTHPEHKKAIELVRNLNRKYRRHIRILQDLEGYRIRIGRLKQPGGVPLKRRQEVFLTNRDVLGSGSLIPFDYEGPLKDIRRGSHIFIEDGKIVLLVKKSSRKKLKAEVIVPGVIKDQKGINIPEVNLRFKGLTAKDRLDLYFGLKEKVDYIAQSFVRDEKDVLPIRDIIRRHRADSLLIAKIENRQGINNIDRILDVVDGIMVARGDMGVCVPIYQIPVLQKIIIKKCIKRKKFVITATQMLESMTQNPLPTRAEVTDVANAVIDGTDFVMLSEETAAGNHPQEAVKIMNQIIKFTESAISEKII